ncbi:Gas vesicle protein [Candidatus Rubidus massiliensis]|nr:Gas vesicle protein [Candidatus Rubidus massiliensis]
MLGRTKNEKKVDPKAIWLGALSLLATAGAAVLLKTTNTKTFTKLLNQEDSWSDKAKNLAHQISDNVHWPKEKKSNDVGLWISGIIGGIIAGATAASLLTPKSGKDLRKALSKGYKNANRKGLEEWENYIEDKGRKVVSKARKTAKKAVSKASRKPRTKSEAKE